jgi:hypothetical protein
MHTNDNQLYGMTPQLQMVALGAMSCPLLVDIALDGSGRLFATTPGTLFEVEIASGACTAIASNGSYPNSLAVVPAPVLDPNEDVLVGLRGSEYVRIDTQTGAVSVLGDVGSDLASSGDVTFLDGMVYATVISSNCADCVLSLHPQTGDTLLMDAPIGHGQVYGLADAGGVLYGFTTSGLVLELSADGAAGSVTLASNLGSIYGATSVP